MPLISSIRQFLMRRVMVKLNRFVYVTLYGMDIGEGVRISRGARLDKTNPKGIHIGAYSAVTKTPV